MTEELLPLLERIAVAWERQAVATEAIAAAWTTNIEQYAERLSLDRAAFDQNVERWAIDDARREEDLARRKAERDDDRQWAENREARNRAGWLASLTTPGERE